MNVGLLLITHNRIGKELLRAATNMLSTCPLPARALNYENGSDPKLAEEEARKLVRQLDDGKGVLVITDIFGATPSNIAMRLSETENVQVVSGASLPMVVRVMNYCSCSLPELAQKAAYGGNAGIVLSHGDEEE